MHVRFLFVLCLSAGVAAAASGQRSRTHREAHRRRRERGGDSAQLPFDWLFLQRKKWCGCKYHLFL